jgi:hypothetical protein
LFPALRFLERGTRLIHQPALADQYAHAIPAHQRPRETLHSCAGGGTYADRGISRRMRRRFVDFSDIGRGVNTGCAGQIKAGGTAAVEHVDLGGIANAEQGSIQRHRIVDAQHTHHLLGDWHGQIIMRHG